MSHPATPTECPKCGDYLVTLSPEWVDGAPTGREVAECRSCGPLDAAAVDAPKPPARKTSAKK